MSDDPRLEVLRELERVWTAKEIDALVGLFAEDCAYEDLALGVRFLGHQGIRQFANDVYCTMPDFTLKLNRLGVGPKYGVSEWTISATWHGEFEGEDRTGTPVKFDGLSMYEFDGNYIVRNTDCWDLTSMARQMKVVPVVLRSFN